MSGLVIVSLIGWIIAFCLQLSFVVAYHMFTRGAWRKSVVGVQLMSMAGVIVMVLGLSLARFQFGDYPFRGTLSALGAVAFVAVSCLQLGILINVQRRKGKE